MRLSVIAVLVTTSMLSGVAGAENTGGTAASSNNASQQPTGAAQGGGFQWTNLSGDVDVVKGKIDKWNDKGELEAGGILGLGDTDLRINAGTVIVSSDGRRLQRSDLRVGRQIATIYRASEATGKKSMGGKSKTALVIVVEK